MSVYTVTDVLDEARVLLNDVGAQLYTNTVLLPIFRIAFDELIRKVQNNGLGLTFQVDSTLSVAIGDTQLNIAALTDLITPIELLEKGVNDPDDMFQPINRREFLPQVVSNNFINYWTWRQQQIFITPPTSARTVQIRYQSDKPTLNLGDQVPVNNAKSFLSSRTAAIAAFTLSNPTKAEALNNNSEERKDEVIRHGVNNKQNLPARRRAFSIYRSARYRG